MSLKQDIAQLEQLGDIRQMRVERAEKALIAAKKAYEEAQEETRKASLEVKAYGEKMPALIDELYETCIGLAVGKSVVEEVRAKEGKIRAKYLSLQEVQREAHNHQKAMMMAVSKAAADLMFEKRHQEGLEEVTGTYEKEYLVEQRRGEGRALDEFATIQAVKK